MRMAADLKQAAAFSRAFGAQGDAAQDHWSGFRTQTRVQRHAATLRCFVAEQRIMRRWRLPTFKHAAAPIRSNYTHDHPEDVQR
jgi:hypothetical protein